MNAAPLPITAPAVRFRWTSCDEVIQTLALPLLGLHLVVVGSREFSVYEWVLTRAGRVTAHSDDAWAKPSDALHAGIAAAREVQPSCPFIAALAAQVIERARRAA